MEQFPLEFLHVAELLRLALQESVVLFSLFFDFFPFKIHKPENLDELALLLLAHSHLVLELQILESIEAKQKGKHCQQNDPCKANAEFFGDLKVVQDKKCDEVANQCQ